MRILLIGATGMLGSEFRELFQSLELEVIAPTHEELDITNPESVAQIGAGSYGELNWVINCAAYTAVDQAEDEPGDAAFLNTLGPSFLAGACAMANVPLVHFSTDYVFDGTKELAYVESDATNPLNSYGLSKRDGEELIRDNWHQTYIFRTSWLFGPYGACFPRSIVRNLVAGNELTVIDDQFGTPTYAYDLARAAWSVIEQRPEFGTYHLAGREVMSWYEFACNICRAFAPELESNIVAIPSSKWPTKAKRPVNSALTSEHSIIRELTLFTPVAQSLPHWLSRAMETY